MVKQPRPWDPVSSPGRQSQGGKRLHAVCATRRAGGGAVSPLCSSAAPAPAALLRSSIKGIKLLHARFFCKSTLLSDCFESIY